MKKQDKNTLRIINLLWNTDVFLKEWDDLKTFTSLKTIANKFKHSDDKQIQTLGYSLNNELDKFITTEQLKRNFEFDNNDEFDSLYSVHYVNHGTLEDSRLFNELRRLLFTYGKRFIALNGKGVA